MGPDWKYKNHPADRSLKEDLSIDTTIEPSYISWDNPFKKVHSGLVLNLRYAQLQFNFFPIFTSFEKKKL